MSKTYKDKANYARFHNREDILENNLRDLADIMDRHYDKSAGMRSGNNRKYESDKKVIARRIERAKDRRQFQRELNKDYDIT
ncbi:MAG TPA: hypothetical protein VNW06_08260 [Cytophagaceae bacterium]|jgi:hypothetical protein|nr:hypothetical protein [Cytophagaceae bacterium]